MLALLKKEIYQFVNSAIGIIVISIFLLILGLFLCFFPTEFNVIDSGLASLEPMFILAPWIFLFLVPAITMRMIAEERKEGTLEFLLTKPLSEWEIVLAKYFAALVIIILSLLPTLVYFVTVHYFLSDRQVDTGAFWGSFFGLVFLGAVYGAIGIFASAVSRNQVIAFILAVVLSLFFYIGFDLISKISFLAPIAQIIAYIGIDYHYASISKGVLDSRDLIYFLSVILFFLFLTKILLQNRK